MKKVEEEIEYKICTVCSEKKPLAEFHKRKEVKDGHRSACKICQARQAQKRYELNREHIIEQTNQYYRENKEQRQHYLHENKGQISERRKQHYRENKEELCECQKQYRRKNKERTSERDKQYYRENREQKCEQKKQYYRENKKEICKYQKEYRQSEKGRIASAAVRHRRRSCEAASEVSLTAKQFQRILKNQRYMCNMCGKKFTKSRPPTMDHIIPVSKGGGLTSSNVQVLCKSCNCKKQAKILKGFIISWTVL